MMNIRMESDQDPPGLQGHSLLPPHGQLSNVESALVEGFVEVKETGIVTQVLLGAALLAVLFGISRYNFLLYHAFVEMFSTAVAWAVFMLVWNSRRLVKNDAFVFLGIALLMIGLINVLHTLSYKGMGVFPELKSANIPTQLWVASRYLESFSLLLFVFFVGKSLNLKTIFWSYLGLTLLILATIFVWPVFPDCFIDGAGLTDFKKNSEYSNCLILALAGFLLWKKQTFIDPDVRRLMFSAILVTIGAGLFFTQYVSVYGLANLLGHFLKIISFYMIYLALIRLGLSRPFSVLFRDIHGARERYRHQARKYANILETTADGFWIADMTGNIVDANNSIAWMLGYSKNELIGKPISEIEVLETAEDIHHRMAAIQQNKYDRFQTIHRRKDGTLIDVEISAVYLDQEGSQIAAFIRNITHTKRAENELRLSEHKFAVAYHSTPLLMGISSVEDGTFLDVNDTFIQITGYAREEVIGHSSVDLGLISAEDRLRLVRILTEKGCLDAMECIITTKNGERRVCQFWAEFIEIQGRSRILAMVHDITDQRRLFDELAQERAVLKAIFESTPDMFALKDASGVYRSVNPSFCRFLGKTAEEIIGQTDFDLFPSKDAEQYTRQDQHVLRTGISEAGDSIVMGAGGRIWLHIVKTAVIGSQGEIDGVLCSVHEITDRKKMESLMQAKIRLSETDMLQYSETDLMRKTIDEAEILTDSQIGFFHFINQDTMRVSVKAWSSRTEREFCHVESIEESKTIRNAGVWIRCIDERRPVIHNGESSMPGRKGAPDGHPTIVRELIVPVFRGDNLVGVLGVGNKPVDYTEQDIRMVSAMADLAWDILSRNRVVTALKDSEDKHRRLAYAIGQAADAIMITDAAGAIQYVNPAFETVTGYAASEIMGENPRILKSGEHDREFYRAMWQTLLGGDIWSGRIINRHKDGTLLTVDGTISPVVDAAGETVGFVAVMRDMTEELNLRNKIRQAQKMEAIGTLAGGIAHDFNNILFPLIGFAEMIRDELPADSSLQPCVEGVLSAASRSSELVKQILSFSRQKEQDKTVIRVQTIVKEVLKLIRAGLPSNIRIEPAIGNTCPPVLADATQLYQVVMNLITNAYHAMETTGGILGVTLKTVPVDALEEMDVHLTPGTYVCLSVSDTGPGIDAFILDRIFEPYFTTKPDGKGTGLGLSISLGIVHDCGGDIFVDSRIGQGTTFRVYLPSAVEGEVRPVSESREDIQGGSEHILVVDDEEAILYMLSLMLKKLGYQVSLCTAGIDAMELFRSDPRRFQLVMTDLTMPNMTGDRLCAELKKIDPDIPVILCTGFSERITPEIIQEIGIDGFVKKPVLKSEIAGLIRRLLDGRKK